MQQWIDWETFYQLNQICGAKNQTRCFSLLINRLLLRFCFSFKFYFIHKLVWFEHELELLNNRNRTHKNCFFFPFLKCFHDFSFVFVSFSVSASKSKMAICKRNEEDIPLWAIYGLIQLIDRWSGKEYILYHESSMRFVNIAKKCVALTLSKCTKEKNQCSIGTNPFLYRSWDSLNLKY